MASLAVVDYVASIWGMRAHSTSSCTTVETSCDLLGGEAHPRLELGRGFDHDVKWAADGLRWFCRLHRSSEATSLLLELPQYQRPRF